MRLVERPGLANLLAARKVVHRYLTPTPLLAAPSVGPGVLLKLETFQPTGSFKVRGGLAAVAATEERWPGTPLVTASAGNHGLGVAYAGDALGANVTVVVPENASEAKVAALGRFGIRLIRHGATYDEAEQHALALADELSGRYISPYNDPDVISGQATIADELLSELPDLQTIVVPVGGGGLLSGIGLGTEGSGVEIVGVEPELANAMSVAMEAGEARPVSVGPTLADGLAGNIEEGSVTIELARGCATKMLTVSEDEITESMRRLAFDHGLVAEGSGAVGLAALTAGRLAAGGGATVVLITGRNISPSLFASVLGA